MSHKGQRSNLKLILVVFIIVVAIGGLFVVIQKNKNIKKNNQTVQTIGQEEKKNTEPIVKKHDGITEVSLPNGETIVNKPTIDQLKDLRKHAEEEKSAASKEREKKIVRIHGAQIEVLPLYTFEDQKKGLIGVEFLPKNSGTLYVFQMDDAGRGFGTKGMKFPLDYIWMNSDLTVVHLTKNVPPDYSGDTMSLWPARYVIETNAGFIDENSIAVGDKAEFEHIPH